ncbi:Nn.00g112860.m01.CDS01 [Neocucurbitaria sp. VM-36]
MADTAASITATAPAPRRAQVPGEAVDNEDDLPFDILAFMALYFGTMEETSKDPRQLALSGTFFDARLLSLASGGGSGGSFAVTVVKSEDMARLQRKNEQEGNVSEILPRLIALRVPKLATSTEQQQRQRILTSMAKEIAVLTNEEVRACENIVKLIGACWSYANPEKTVLLPVLVYEAAPLGDLDAFLLSHKNLPIGHQLQICVDIAQGVERLHHVGVVHCDIKPKNIIIFSTADPKRPYKAKIADFGCAIMLDDIETSTRPPPGTRFWNPPEQLNGDLVHKDMLHRVDVFTLALVILTVLTSSQSTNTLMHISNREAFMFPRREQQMGFDYFKRWGSLVMSGLMILERFSNLTVTQRSSIKATPQERLIPAHLLDDDNWLDYSEQWNKHISSVLFRALQGGISDRDASVRDIASVLEAILVSVEVWGQRNHVRADLHEVQQAGNTTVSMHYVFEHESKSLMDQVRPLIVFKETESMVVVKPGWMFSPHPEMDLSYVHSRIKGMNYQEDWEEIIFGPRRLGEKPRLTVRKRAGQVVKLSNYLGNLSLMPVALLDYILHVLDGVVNDRAELMKRRSIAAYELALGLIVYRIDEFKEDGDEEEVARVLQLLGFALENGLKEATWTIGWIFESFGKKYTGENLEWLSEGMIAGSRMAARRLERLDASKYEQTRHLIQTKYQGIGEGWAIPPEYIQNNAIYIEGQPIPESNQLVLFAAGGMKEKLEILLNKGVDINSLDGMRETPLIAACRSGHVEIVECLIERGADVTMLSKENISALHFLSSFDWSKIPYIALLLLAAGCPLETHSTGHSSLNNGHTGADRFYGLVDGTPLLWAVAADNVTAVETLLDFGADPFDLTQRRSTFYPYSPVSWATSMHQVEMLEHLLSATPERQLASLLNPLSNTFTGPFRGPPLGSAVAYSGGLVFYRIQLHGSEHREKCRKTIHLLLSKGADPAGVGTSNEPALHAAGLHGQPYAFQALLDWNNGCLKPDTKIWVEILIGAVANDRKSTFRELLNIPLQTTEEYSWPRIIATVAGSQNSRFYLNKLISHHQELSNAPADYTIAFEEALQNECFENARIVFDRADKCDIVHRRYQDDEDSSNREIMTLLGRLMRQAIIYASKLQAVREFLALTGSREILFDNVWDLEIGRYNALQVAVGYFPHGKTKTITAGLLELILHYFKHPTRHLAPIHYIKNRSLLHLAVRYGNAPAVEILLEYPGIDVSHRDDEGGTAFDRALNRLQDSWREQELAYWDVPASQWPQAREDWDNHTRTMIHVMQAKGASKYSTYSHLFKRVSRDMVRRWMIYPDDGRIEVTDFRVETFVEGAIAEKVKSLEVGRCTYFSAFGDAEGRARMQGGRELDVGEVFAGGEGSSDAAMLAPDSRPR